MPDGQVRKLAESAAEADLQRLEDAWEAMPDRVKLDFINLVPDVYFATAWMVRSRQACRSLERKLSR